MAAERARLKALLGAGRAPAALAAAEAVHGLQVRGKDNTLNSVDLDEPAVEGTAVDKVGSLEKPDMVAGWRRPRG